MTSNHTRSRQSRNDPTQAGRFISSYEADLKAYLRAYVTGCMRIIKQNRDSPANISEEIDRLKTDLKPRARKIAEKYATISWQQGRTFAELNLKKYGK